MRRIIFLTLAIMLFIEIPFSIALCPYVPGDVNGNGRFNGIDITYAVGFFKGGSVPPVHCDMCPQPIPFYAAGDFNGNCVFNGVDITYIMRGGVVSFCPSCPPDSLR
jgi:hypothetical protein